MRSAASSLERTGLLARAEDVLRGRPWTVGDERPARVLGRLAMLVLAFGMSYGAAMGTFGGVAGDRWLQVVYSAVKVPILLLATCALSLPSFFVLNTLVGLRDDFAVALRALLAAQAGLTIILVALAPLTLLWYASSAAYHAAILFNALMFTVASAGAQVMLRRAYRPLVARDPRHRVLLRLWLVVYAFVGIQMGWMLRPFVGEPARPVEFFREDTWGNAYVIVARMVAEQFGL
jgi:hypothetical protein